MVGAVIGGLHVGEEPGRKTSDEEAAQVTLGGDIINWSSERRLDKTFVVAVPCVRGRLARRRLCL
jgi:hypothetical protein